MVSKFHSSLSQDLSLILNDSDDCNVIIVVGNNQNIKEFRAHSYILRARSPYFKNAFSKKEFQVTFIVAKDGWITSNNVMKFIKPNINPVVFEIILRYIYTGEVNLTNTSDINILELLVASDELLLEELLEHVQDYLIENQTNWIQKNFIFVLHAVIKLASCKKLQDYCFESICADPQPFFTSNLLHKDILYGLLKRNDLQIEEIVVWDSLIKWGIEQIPGFGITNNDRTKWNKENYESLKKTLDQFIPLIRFVDISPAEYFDKVRPYKTIIPNQICEEIEEFYLKGTLPITTTLPSRTGIVQNINSNIIKPKLSTIIINWIERKDSNYNRNRKDTVYNFNLIYRKSHDSDNNILGTCAVQGAILILIQVERSEKIFGGYNPIGWCNNNNSRNINRGLNFKNQYNQYNQYLSTADSFIFSFENEEDIRNKMISRVVNPSHAIYAGNGKNGLFGGINFGGGDLALNNGYLTLCYSGNYEKFATNNYDSEDASIIYRSNESIIYDEDETTNNRYKVREIEVFKVVRL
ncbi:hypothetical protein RclHR1_00330008 [Rhizophagus clarus]|uniref:BTB domain-containing protein n=1 Tax=Rhizophagus clarus TaxID=94130 RepID=A0A2Z6RQ40_9GLOM|nr:hypothetical protein RclHR1_00330008 [Rhizophagus clarus]GES81752.1 hypothetical protein GLOIN_2v1636839 [Rhizophagus clarus]